MFEEKIKVNCYDLTHDDNVIKELVNLGYEFEGGNKPVARYSDEYTEHKYLYTNSLDKLKTNLNKLYKEDKINTRYAIHCAYTGQDPSWYISCRLNYM